jgi:hypothetical protein
MRIFHHEKTDMIIVTPYRNGSSFLYYNKDNLGLTQLSTHSVTLEDIDNEKTEDTLALIKKLNATKNKIFLYRNPLERFYSYYNSFIYEDSTAITPQTISDFFSGNRDVEKYHRTNRKGYDDEYYIKDLYINFSKIKKSFVSDPHLSPQMLFFKYYEQELRKYRVIDFSSYGVLIKKLFGNEIKKFDIDFFEGSSPSNKMIRLFDVDYVVQINNKLREFYKDDFEKIGTMAELI